MNGLALLGEWLPLVANVAFGLNYYHSCEALFMSKANYLL